MSQNCFFQISTPLCITFVQLLSRWVLNNCNNGGVCGSFVSLRRLYILLVYYGFYPFTSVYPLPIVGVKTVFSLYYMCSVYVYSSREFFN